MLRSLTIGAFLLVLKGTALGNPYDDCILQHMGAAQVEAAVDAIQTACIAKTAVPIPPDVDSHYPNVNPAYFARMNVGRFNTGYSLDKGLLITFQNTTDFAVTEVLITVRDKKTKEVREYPVDSFNEPLPQGVWLTKPAELSYRRIIAPGSTRRFFVHVEEVTDDPEEFSKRFDWNFTLKKGIPPK